MKILFVNSSPNKNGNTAKLAAELLKGKSYETLNLNDYRINFYGQTLPGDQFTEVIDQMQKADVLVIGSPLYWHNLDASLRALLDHSYGSVDEDVFAGKDLYFLIQGAAPEKWMLDACEYTMKRYASFCGMNYAGMATNRSEAKELGKKISSH